jgi:hypothetical protein
MDIDRRRIGVARLIEQNVKTLCENVDFRFQASAITPYANSLSGSG